MQRFFSFLVVFQLSCLAGFSQVVFDDLPGTNCSGVPIVGGATPAGGEYTLLTPSPSAEFVDNGDGTFTITFLDDTFGGTLITLVEYSLGDESDIAQVIVFKGQAEASSTASSGADGTATVNVTIGAGPFDYLWSDGQTTQTATGLAPGDYSVLVTLNGSGGCTVEASATVASPTIFFDNIEGTKCGGVPIVGGATPDGGEYSLFIPSPSVELLDNNDGTFTITFLDNTFGGTLITFIEYTLGNESEIAQVTIFQGQAEVLTTPSSGVDGTATANVLTGIGPFDYLWSDGQTTQTAEGLAPGSYSVEVTLNGSSGCLAFGSGNVDPIAPPIPEVTDFWCNNTVETNDIIRCSWENNNRPEAFQWRFTRTDDGSIDEFGPYENVGFDRSLPLLRMDNFTELVPGATYNVDVRNRLEDGSFSSYGPACPISISDVSELSSGMSPLFDGGSFELCHVVKAIPVGGATSYEWTFTQQGMGTEFTATRNNTVLKLDQVPGLVVPADYEVSVQAVVGGQITGTSTTTLATVFKPTRINASTAMCDGVVAIGSNAQAINVCGADSYTFRFQNIEGGEPIEVVRPNRVIIFNRPEFTPNSTWEVTVFANTGENSADPGEVCTLTFVEPMLVGIDGLQINDTPDFNLENVNASISAYPNPVILGGELNIVISDLDAEDQRIQIDLYDMTGKVVVSKVYGNASANFNTALNLDNIIAEGFYLMQTKVNGVLLDTEKVFVK